MAEAPAQPEVHPGQGTATDHGPDEGGHLPAAVGKGSDGGGTGYEDRTANAPRVRRLRHGYGAAPRSPGSLRGVTRPRDRFGHPFYGRAVPPAREGRGRHPCPASHGRSQGRCRTACRGLLSAGPASRRALAGRRGGFSCRARGRRAATGWIRCAGGVGGVPRVDGVLFRLPLGRE